MTTRSSLSSKSLVPVTLIERRIYLIRGHKVMIDTDLAQLYGVPTYRLNEAVKRNRRRFPSDFMFQLSKKEAESLTSQFAIWIDGWMACAQTRASPTCCGALGTRVDR